MGAPNTDLLEYEDRMNWSLAEIDSIKEGIKPAEGPRVVIVSDVLLYREGLAASIRRDARCAADAANTRGGGFAPAGVSTSQRRFTVSNRCRSS